MIWGVGFRGCWRARCSRHLCRRNSCGARWTTGRGRGHRGRSPGAVAGLPDGLTHYQWHGPARGPVAVGVHGLTTPCFDWRPIAAVLGCRVPVHVLFGRGCSDRPCGRQDRAFFVRQLDELLTGQSLTGQGLAGQVLGGQV